ncbi:MAG: AAA family ATPase, partial [Anaerostipes sp.]|nr:AAA family ATPase [Anaerostipes sp.]
MQITYLHVQNFKSIKNLEIKNIQNALIFVGKNNAGKTSLLQALNSVSGHYQINENDFDELGKNIEISISLHITKDDLSLLHENGIVSQYKKYDLWYKDFCKKLPSYLEEELTFTFVCNK